MSNALALASVTRILQDLLNDAMVNSKVTDGVAITALPPDRALAGVKEEEASLNLFLHRITPNPALTNADLPSRGDRGNLVRNPRLALDLHYLLTAYTNAPLKGEILLGYAMEMLHETPVLARGQVRLALKDGLNGTSLPKPFDKSDPARLADQIELIRITPQTLSMDDMSRLWTAFQTNYRTTVAYQVSVVLIERDMGPRNPLPVLSRGRMDETTNREAGLLVQPDLMPVAPMLVSLVPPNGQPALRLGDRLAINGHHLDSVSARVRFTDPESGRSIELAPDSPPSPERAVVTLPKGAPLAGGHPLEGSGSDPGAWRIGPYMVDMVLQSSGEPERTTNRLPVLLAPKATPSAAAAGAATTIKVLCEPPIRKRQTAAIIAGQIEQPVAIDADTGEVQADFAGLPKGAQIPVRLRVGGIDSLLVDRAARPPTFDSTQIVQVP